LIDNAVKFTETGHVMVSARHLPEQHALELRVLDTGIGISTAALPSIFEKFYQADASQTRTYGGVGLGLHIVKKLTDLLGVNISVESAENQGTAFTLNIPLGREAKSYFAAPSSSRADADLFRPNMLS
jgi:signal transduction histidine kinase